MKTTVAYLGPDPATYGYMAVSGYFPANPENNFVPYGKHPEIIQAVGNQKVDFGVVAVENRIDGAIAETIRAMVKACANSGVHVCGEVIVDVHHLLLRQIGAEGLPTKVTSHSSALNQCGKEVALLGELGIGSDPCNSTSEAAKMANDNPSILAIAGLSAKEYYPNLESVSFDSGRDREKTIVDHLSNQTRFWVISRQIHTRTGNDKTAILINLDHEGVGGVSKFTKMFADRDLNLLWIYSHPIPARPWEYAFLVEYMGHSTDPAMVAALAEFTDSGLALNDPIVLGSYPIAS